jgi:twitching motility protein PilT
MATVLIDKLLQAAVKQGASDIHIVVGQPPVFRLHGRMRKLETKVLEPEDTMALDEEYRSRTLPARAAGSG